MPDGPRRTKVPRLNQAYAVRGLQFSRNELLPCCRISVGARRNGSFNLMRQHYGVDQGRAETDSAVHHGDWAALLHRIRRVAPSMKA